MERHAKQPFFILHERLAVHNVEKLDGACALAALTGNEDSSLLLNDEKTT